MTDGSGHPVQVAGRELDGDPRVVDGEPPQPPEAPLQDKRWIFFRHQLIGIPLMMVVVVAAMLGVFGESQSTVSADNGAAEVTVHHISSFRYKMIGPLDITVENSSSQPLTAVTVHVERTYLDEFSNVMFTPSPTALTSEWAAFELGDVPPGESVAITGEIQAESFGSHEGVVRLSVEGMEPIVITISTLSLP